MALAKSARNLLCGGLLVTLAACGGKNGGTAEETRAGATSGAKQTTSQLGNSRERANREGGTIWNLFGASDDPNVTVEVNKYIWQASLEVLNFLPIESVDPFTGVIVTGYGRPPGGGRAYRATIYVQDPALEARSLKIAMQSQGGGAVAPETVRAVEDAILTRARQLRIRDSKL
ncbi:DUF3576 domain-containing protein [Pseudogemmobacter bohemicus]|uniref:DUF3576 domain-containing protein n=1 Tax=Pseudogemmobacter bohemicus TaxID=2250708 RepID=UPI000DD3878E|nr:DUF3576 domain-containing protein [Pseudogemmobacter bohemicus]